MSKAKITLLGMYKWDNTVFDLMQLPAGIDKSLLRDAILLKAGDFESLYGDPDFIKSAVSVWSRKWYRTIEKWYNALQLKYDPIYNYDRHEEWVTDDTGTQSSTSKDHNTASTDSTSTDKVSAYNSEQLVNDRQNVSEAGSTSDSRADLSADHANKEVRKGRAYGNIGVTTSQQMLQSELDIAMFNLYEHIVDIFLAEFVIPVF